MFPTTDGPRFHRGTGILLGLSAALTVFAALNSAYLHWRNKQRERVLLQAASASAGYDGESAGSRRVEGVGEGDENVNFRYIT